MLVPTMNVFLPFRTLSLYSVFAAFRKMVYDGVRSMILLSMYWCLMAVLNCFFFFIVLHLLYLTLYPACFEVEQRSADNGHWKVSKFGETL